MKTILIDTHCHLNFKRFNKTLENTIKYAIEQGVGGFIVPGTDGPTSQKAVAIAKTYPPVYAAVGFHPHHMFEIKKQTSSISSFITSELTPLLAEKTVVAIGEVGLDRHVYEDTKYPDYQISPAFITDQQEALTVQLQLAEQYDKALILHNRETKSELLALLEHSWSDIRRNRTVFHCCEPDRDLLAFALAHEIFIGVDGDLTYGGTKTSFIKEVPLSRLVLETDSPFLLPEPLKSKRLYPNTPATIPLIAEAVAHIKGVSIEEVAKQTTENAQVLFSLSFPTS